LLPQWYLVSVLKSQQDVIERARRIIAATETTPVLPAPSVADFDFRDPGAASLRRRRAAANADPLYRQLNHCSRTSRSE
jgi:hypothetical protein